jgi:hypothetical protein
MKGQSEVKGNTGAALAAAIGGALCIVAVPFLMATAMTAVLEGAAVKIPASGNPMIATAPRIVISFFPVWGGLSIAAGIALLLAAWGVYKREAWAKPAAIGLLAIPAITGAYLSGPVMLFAKSVMPIFIIVALIGLIPYFVLLLGRTDVGGSKIGTFFLFLMLGVTAAWSFSNGGSSLRQFWARPEYYPLNASNTGFALGVPVIWTGVLATIFSIPFLAAGTRAGWRLALVGLGIILMGNLMLFVTHTGTKEYMIGIIMAVISLILLVIPSIGRSQIKAAA